MEKKKIITIASIAGAAGIAGAIGLALKLKPSMPKGAEPVQPFDITRFLGKWYEIARLDYRYEHDLKHVTAEYSLNKDGSIKVNNQGLNAKTGEWEQSVGKARFASSPRNKGALKVSFFGPFYSGYNVIGLDEEYQYALIAGDSLKNLWLLSRDIQIPEPIKQNYLAIAESLGYDTEKLVWVEQQKMD
jgi:apolipoprotein D and lipocalin family protein